MFVVIGVVGCRRAGEVDVCDVDGDGDPGAGVRVVGVGGTDGSLLLVPGGVCSATLRVTWVLGKLGGLFGPEEYSRAKSSAVRSMDR